MCCRSRKEHQTRLVTTGLLKNMSLRHTSSIRVNACLKFLEKIAFLNLIFKQVKNYV